jgi:hypothetical protein
MRPRTGRVCTSSPSPCRKVEARSTSGAQWPTGARLVPTRSRAARPLKSPPRLSRHRTARRRRRRETDGASHWAGRPSRRTTNVGTRATWHVACDLTLGQRGRRIDVARCGCWRRPAPRDSQRRPPWNHAHMKRRIRRCPTVPNRSRVDPAPALEAKSRAAIPHRYRHLHLHPPRPATRIAQTATKAEPSSASPQPWSAASCSPAL